MSSSTLGMQTVWKQGTTQVVAATASSTAIGTKFGAQTYAIRLSANLNCWYKIGDISAPTADVTSSSYLPVHVIEYVKVNPGQFISVIQAATAGADTATTGSLAVTELTS